jgi:hypothetical protein
MMGHSGAKLLVGVDNALINTGNTGNNANSR